MNKASRARRKKRKAALLIVLALLCIGGAELAACRFFDPVLYSRITAPVRHSAQAALDTGRRATAAVWDFLTGLVPDTSAPVEETEAPEDVELQLAAEPIIASDLPIADPAVTELKDEDGVQRLTGNGISTDRKAHV